MSGQEVSTEEIVKRLERVTGIEATEGVIFSNIPGIENGLFFETQEGFICELYIYSLTIVDLDALFEVIGLCSELESLAIEKCQLSDISRIRRLASMDKLTELKLSKNEIESLSPLTELKYLKKLDISDNPIDEQSLQIVLSMVSINTTRLIFQ